LEVETSSTQIGRRLESAEIIAANNDTDKNEIRRYVHLTHLISPLLDLVDSEKIPFIAGYDLSYLNADAQTLVHAFFFDGEQGVRLDLKMAASLRVTFKENGELSDRMIEVLCQSKSDTKYSKSFSINRKKLQPYLDRLPDDTELERLFLEFIEFRFGRTVA
jgi:ParB family chromosome partitioning protein